MGFLGKPVTDDVNLDQSPLAQNQDKRDFWGGQVTYNGLDHHKPFAYFMSNDDHDRAETATQRYNYSSQYVGVGSTGTVISPNLKYSTELVDEEGKTYSWHDTEQRNRIQAWAYDALLEYYFQVPTHPKVMGEYLYASGDADREFSSTNTDGGNRIGTSDHAFNAFGFRDTGVALRRMCPT